MKNKTISTALRSTTKSAFLLLISLIFSLKATAYDTLPITLTTEDGLCDKLDFAFEDWNMHYYFTSRVYHLESDVKRLRFIVPETTSGDSGGGYPCFALAEFYLYDGNGKQVSLTAKDFSTNAQEPSEGPMRNICDNNVGTFFHSLWSYRNESTGEHYIDVSLPTSMKDFAFGYVSRYNNVAPTKIIIDDAYRLDEEKQKEDEERERLENHRDSLVCTVTEVVKGQQWDLDLALESTDDYLRYTALQMDIVPVSEGMSGEGIDISFELKKERLPSHTLAIGKGDWGTPRVVIYSMSLDSIRGISGTLLHIRLSSEELVPAGRYVFYVTNIRLTSVQKIERLLDSIEIAVISTDPSVPEPNNVFLTSVGAEGMAKLSADKAKPGERVYLHANPTAEWLFKGWAAAEEDVVINAPESAHTYFTMPDHDVHVTAVFETNGISTVNADTKVIFHTLDGRRTDHPAKGIYIVSGKKVLVK